MAPYRAVSRAAFAAAAIVFSFAAAASGGDAPRQSRPQQLAQACRTLCVDELNACQRSCDNETVRIDCQARCQTRFNLCTAACR
jgi:hypothetical protein